MRMALPDSVARAMPEFRPRRTVPPRLLTDFGAHLASQMATAGPQRATASSLPRVIRPTAASRGTAGVSKPSDAAAVESGTTPVPGDRARLLTRAQEMLGIPYVWGGNTLKGLDCSAYLSRVWGVPRQTTDTLHRVADPISKDELQPGDAMNLPTWKDPKRFGHVRMFDRWANPERTKVWVYEETAEVGKSVHRVIDYDARYQPMRLRDVGGGW